VKTKFFSLTGVAGGGGGKRIGTSRVENTTPIKHGFQHEKKNSGTKNKRNGAGRKTRSGEKQSGKTKTDGHWVRRGRLSRGGRNFNQTIKGPVGQPTKEGLEKTRAAARGLGGSTLDPRQGGRGTRGDREKVTLGGRPVKTEL